MPKVFEKWPQRQASAWTMRGEALEGIAGEREQSVGFRLKPGEKGAAAEEGGRERGGQRHRRFSRR